jgi:hypothetical protein
MKKAIKELSKIRIEILEIKDIIKHTKTSTYFKHFGNEEQRNHEILVHNSELKKLLKLEFTALENLQKQCEKAKVKNSYKSRKINLLTNIQNE